MKEKIFSCIFVLFLSIIGILNIIIPDKQITDTERRKLKQFPTLNINTVLNGEFFDDLEDSLAWSERWDLPGKVKSESGFIKLCNNLINHLFNLINLVAIFVNYLLMHIGYHLRYLLI